MTSTSPAVHAVLVTYRPSLGPLEAVLRSLCSQVDRVELVDNTPLGSSDFAVLDVVNSLGLRNVYVRSLGANLGIAYAQNVGIQCALETGSEYIFLSDQDTIFPDNCVQTLVGCIERLEMLGNKAAAVGPAYVNLHSSGQSPMFLGFGRGWTSRIHGDSGCVEASGLIASGMLIRAEALREIGGMNEDLFIDWVDFEWCWRAIAAGYQVIGCFDTVISHRLGDDAIRIGRSSFSVRSPTRTYYIARNGIHLALRSKELPFLASVTVAYRAIKWSLAASVLNRPGLAHAGQALRGVFHGLAGNLGSIDRPHRFNRSVGRLRQLP